MVEKGVAEATRKTRSADASAAGSGGVLAALAGVLVEAAVEGEVAIEGLIACGASGMASALRSGSRRVTTGSVATGGNRESCIAWTW